MEEVSNIGSGETRLISYSDFLIGNDLIRALYSFTFKLSL